MTPTPEPSAAVTTGELREAVTYPHSGNLSLWRCPDCRCHSYAQVDERKPDSSFGPGPLIRCVNCKSIFDTRPTALATSTTPPPAGNVEALRALADEAERAERSDSFAAAARTKVDFELAAVNYVRTQVLPAQTTTAAAPGAEGGVEYRDLTKALLFVAGCQKSATGENTTASLNLSMAADAIERLSAALARRSAPATGGAARLDRNDLIEELAKHLHDEHDENTGGGGENHVWPDHPDDDGRRSNGYVRIAPPSVQQFRREAAARILRFLDQPRNQAILALDPAPQSQAASEGVGSTIPLALVLRECFEEGHLSDEAKLLVTAALLRIWPGDRQTVETCACERDPDLDADEPKCVECPTDAHWRAADAKLDAWLKARPDALAAITPAGRGADAGGWRPIETAPKDGTKFDAWVVHPYSGGMGSRFADVQMRGDGSGFGVVTHQPKAVWDYIEQNGPTFPVWRLTHWRPLPAAPTAQGGE